MVAIGSPTIKRLDLDLKDRGTEHDVTNYEKNDMLW